MTGSFTDKFSIKISALLALVFVLVLQVVSDEEPNNREVWLEDIFEFRKGFSGAVNFGPSFGFYPGNKDKYFWGFSGGYTRIIKDNWSATATLAWDEEVERQDNGPDSKIHTFTAIGTVNCNVTDWTVLTAGVGNGFLDDDNPQQRYTFGVGDWSIGTSLGQAWPIHEALDFILSCAVEYNIDRNEVDISFDGGLSVPL